MDRLQAGLAWLGGQMRTSAASPVTYFPASDSTSQWSLLATIGPSQRLLESGELMVSFTNLDFSISAADFLIEGVQVFPRRGDTIRAIIGGFARMFEVHLEGRQEVWEFTDSSKTRFRIHTNDVSSSP